MRAKDLLESSWAPIELGNRQKESRIDSRNREQKLGFLHGKFSFKPRINTSVPDFDGLYWAFQKEALSKQEIREATHNKPFKLRTSNLRCKHRTPNHGMMVKRIVLKSCTPSYCLTRKSQVSVLDA